MYEIVFHDLIIASLINDTFSGKLNLSVFSNSKIDWYGGALIFLSVFLPVSELQVILELVG